MTIARLPLAVLLLAFAGLVAAGCQKQPHIERYQVAKPVPIESVTGAGTQPAEEPAAKPSGEPTDRMLGAILPHGEAIWFFKLMGKKDAVASLDEPFTALVKSVHFAEGGKPQWTLPEGWHESPGPAPRHATITATVDGKPLETTVTMLPNASDVLQNVNRWRGQLSLPPITADQLPGETSEIAVDGTKATLVNLLGRASAGGMRPPFMSGARDGN
jgi:hypothetical protein